MTRAAQGKGLQAGKKDRITVAGSAAQADLVVEVLARRSQKQLGAVVPSDCWVLFSIGPGGKTAPARFAKIPVTYRARKFMLMAWKIASPTPREAGLHVRGLERRRHVDRLPRGRGERRVGPDR